MKCIGPCQQDLSDEHFAWKTTNKKRQNRCRECQKSYNAEHYRKNKVKIMARVVARNKSEQNLNVIKYSEYLKQHPCVDCGESDIVVLDPDHQHDKRMNVSRMIRSRYTWNTILLELEKCQIRCANCHRRKTAKEQGWRKLLHQVQ